MPGCRIFVIVVTYNGEKWIKKCLSSLRKSEIPVSVIVVDNCSTDGTKPIVQNQFPESFLIEPKENLGFGKANNLGIKHAITNGADYVFLLNQDAWVEPNTLSILLSTYRRETESGNMIGILSPIHLNGKGDKLDLLFLNYLVEESTPNLFSDAVLNKQKDFYEAGFVNAAAWLISRGCIQKVGGFDPVFPHYGEDDDYVKRVKFHGYKVGVARCYIYHDREVRRKKGGKDPNELNVNRLHILNLLVLKNLHKPYNKNVFSFFRRNFNKSIRYLLDLKFKETSYLIMAFFKSAFMLRVIYTSHKRSKNSSNPFLSK